MTARYVRPMRWRAFGVGALLAVTGCSGSDPDSLTGSSTIAPSTTEAVGDRAADPTVPDPAGASETDLAPLSASSLRIDATTSFGDGEIVGTLADSEDPFGRFVSCAGLRDRFGTYSVLASDTNGTIRSISVLSTDLVGTPGTHDASVRIEFASTPAIDAVGTVTIADDYRSGSYVAFDLDGRKVDGTFECVGPTTPRPFAVGAADGVLETVEVFALLRVGEAQRVVGLAADIEGSSSLECPGAAGVKADTTIVRVLGDARIGAITEFSLTDGSSTRLRIGVGPAIYDFENVHRGGVDTPATGTFSAESGDVTVDGAFRCS
jgi:hypothetical protein